MVDLYATVRESCRSWSGAFTDVCGRLKNMHQGEGRAGDLTFLSCSQSADDSLGEGGFPGAQVPRQKHQDGRRKRAREFPALFRGLFRGTRNEIRTGQYWTDFQSARNFANVSG